MILCGKAVRPSQRRLLGRLSLCCAALCCLPASVSGQDLERFFWQPRFTDSNSAAARAAPEVLELQQDQALWTALAFEDVEQLRNLLKRGADPNKPDELSLMTPLMAAETLPITGALLEAGADPRARDRIGRTPLHFAVKMREALSVIPLLARSGADINARTSPPEAVTPLFSAVEHYLEDANKDGAGLIIRMLVRLGADINAADDNGATVLAVAAAQNQPELIRLLMELGADPARRLTNGRTPLDYAKEANANAAIQLLDGVTGRIPPAN
jgi:cytohesin